MSSLLDKTTMANLRARDYAEACSLMESANEKLHKALLRAHNGEFEDAFSECEYAEACCKVALRHLEELLP